MGSEEGGKFSGSIRVSAENACVSKGYTNGERFGFGVLCATIFCARISATASVKKKPHFKLCLMRVIIFAFIAPSGINGRTLRAIAFRSSAKPPVLTHACGVWVRYKKTKQQGFTSPPLRRKSSSLKSRWAFLHIFTLVQRLPTKDRESGKLGRRYLRRTVASADSGYPARAEKPRANRGVEYLDGRDYIIVSMASMITKRRNNQWNCPRMCASTKTPDWWKNCGTPWRKTADIVLAGSCARRKTAASARSSGNSSPIPNLPDSVTANSITRRIELWKYFT